MKSSATKTSTKHKLDISFIFAHDSTACQGLRFAPMMKQYLEKVNATSKLIFCSFLSPNSAGEMVSELSRLGIESKQFRLDSYKPDLSKFEDLLGLVSLLILDQNAAKEKKGDQAQEVEKSMEDLDLQSEWCFVDDAGENA